MGKRLQPVEKTCPICVKTFESYAPNQVYCSADCAKVAARERKNASRRKNHAQFLEWTRQYRKKNAERLREYALTYNREYYKKNRDLICLNRRIRYYDKCVEHWNSSEEVT